MTSRSLSLPVLVSGLLLLAPGALVDATRGARQSYDAYLNEGGLREIMPGHYVFTRKATVTFNSGIIVTDGGVVVFEPLLNDEVARTIRTAIRQVTDQRVRYLVSSSFHEFYSGGAGAYHDAHNVGHEQYRAHLLDALAGAPRDVLRRRLPDQTYRDRLTLHLGGKEIQILHLGRGHTRGDSAVFVPEDRIVYLGELYSHHEFPSLADSYSEDWVDALDRAGALDADVFVPGHGVITENPTESRRGMRRFRQLLVDLRHAVQAEIVAASTEDEAVANISLPTYAADLGYERGLEGAVRRVYQEMTVGLD